MTRLRRMQAANADNPSKQSVERVSCECQGSPDSEKRASFDLEPSAQEYAKEFSCPASRHPSSAGSDALAVVTAPPAVASRSGDGILSFVEIVFEGPKSGGLSRSARYPGRKRSRGVSDMTRKAIAAAVGIAVASA